MKFLEDDYLLELFFKSYCCSEERFVCSLVCKKWRCVLKYKVDISCGREEVPIEIYCEKEDLKLNFIYVVDNVIRDEEIKIEELNYSCNCKINGNNTCSNNQQDNLSTCECLKINHSFTSINFRNCDGKLNLNYLYPIYECNDSCNCNEENCCNRIMKSGISHPLYLFYNEQKGFGVKCKTLIEKGSFICEYLGEYLTNDKANKQLLKSENNQLKKRKLDNEKEEDQHYLLVIEEYFEKDNSNQRTNIDSSIFGNISRFFNHSCSPNLTVRLVRNNSTTPRVCFFALNDIEPNTELCFHYGSIIYSKDQPFNNLNNLSNRKCYCGSLNCLGYLPFTKI
ncbi:hypothetical protein ABK040_009402 [Willaertia magna]